MGLPPLTIHDKWGVFVRTIYGDSFRFAGDYIACLRYVESHPSPITNYQIMRIA